MSQRQEMIRSIMTDDGCGCEHGKNECEQCKSMRLSDEPPSEYEMGFQAGRRNAQAEETREDAKFYKDLYVTTLAEVKRLRKVAEAAKAVAADHCEQGCEVFFSDDDCGMPRLRAALAEWEEGE